MGDINDMARPDGPGSHPSDQAPAGLGASRFDPSRAIEPDPDCEYCFGSGSVETGGDEAHTAFSVACICTAYLSEQQQ